MTEVSFGEWLKRQRMGKGLTREQLAHQIGCAVITLRKIEAEERHPSVQIVERLMEILNIPSDQNTAFLRFARGDWRSAPMGAPVNFPWLQSEADEVSQPAIHLATFLFTDIEGSAKLWDLAPEKMKVALQRHHEILQNSVISNGGSVFQIVGDAFCAAFPTVGTAISAAITAQQALYQEPWDLPFPIRVRMGIHTGESERSPNSPLLGGYASNQTLNRVARVLSAAHGGQILLSLVTKDLIKDTLPANTDLRDMGEHHLKNLIHPEHLFQLKIAGLPTEFPPLNTLDLHRHNLPVQLTSFIGREKEIAGVILLLEKSRLLTLIGPGGTGKTRLSMEVASRLFDQYPDGAWIVELAPIWDPLLIPRTTAIAMGLRDEPQRPAIDMLCDYLRGKKTLIILDNCEHLVEACAQLADTLLRACPHVCILATSREALGIAGETSYLVPSLELPDMQTPSTVESLNQCEAVRLFIERASAKTQSFVMTDKNAAAIAQICHGLDGIPLAIELAAGKVRALSVQQIAQRLDDRFHLLTEGNRTALPRHQTLQAAIEWSHNLLSLSEQVLFRRLSVFVNGWTLEAAESVCADRDATTGNTLKTEDILECLTQLVHKSLVMTEERNDEIRYHMLETIRQYAHKKLNQAGESEELRDKHLEYFHALAAQAKPHLNSAQQIVWIDRLETELDNIRFGLTWAQEGGSVAAGLQLVADLLWFWIFRYYFQEPLLALKNLLTKPLLVDQIRLLAQAHIAAAWLEFLLGNFEAGFAHAKESERLCLQRGLAGRAELAAARNLLIQTQVTGEHPSIQTRQALEENMRLLQEVGDQQEMAKAKHLMSIVLEKSGDQTGARHALEQSMMLFRECGDHIRAAQMSKSLAIMALEEGKYAEAGEHFATILSFSRQSSINLGIDELLWFLGVTAIREQDYVRAKTWYTECLLFCQQIGSPDAQLPECLIGFAGIASAEKRFERAAQIVGATKLMIEARPGPSLENFDQIELKRLTAILREELGDARFEALALQGRTMTMEQAIAYALDNDE